METETREIIGCYKVRSHFVASAKARWDLLLNVSTMRYMLYGFLVGLSYCNTGQTSPYPLPVD